MSIFKECPVCGAHLDPGEACDCREPRLVTYADWEAAGSFEKAASPGDAVEERIVDEFLNCLPPVRQERGFIQCGEPYSHEYDPETGHWRATFATFQKQGDTWHYDKDSGVRHLREVKLWEVSVVTWAMNPEAVITDYKQAAEAAERANAMAAEAVADVKAGRKISAARMKALKEASASMKAATKALDSIIREAGEESTPKGAPAPEAGKGAHPAGATTIEILL